MTDIYDRALWPAPSENPLVVMLQSGRQWFTNEELVTGLGLAKGRALLSNGTSFVRTLGPDDTAIQSATFLIPEKRISRAHGGTVRMFNRRALVLAAMRSETINAVAFRDWLASRAAGEVDNG